MKILLLSLALLLSVDAHALIGSTTVQIIDQTNPSGADIDSTVVDVSERGGYSIHCALTGSLQMTGSIYASNQKIVPPALPASQVFTILSGTTAIMDNTGFMYDVVISNVGYVKLVIGTFSGAGTAKCYLTTKDI